MCIFIANGYRPKTSAFCSAIAHPSRQTDRESVNYKKKKQTNKQTNFQPDHSLQSMPRVYVKQLCANNQIKISGVMMQVTKEWAGGGGGGGEERERERERERD